MPVLVGGPTRPGHGVVVLEREPSGSWCAAWLDLGVVEFAGHLDDVLAWALEQPAAEHLLSVPELGGEVPLRGNSAREYLHGQRRVGARLRLTQVMADLSTLLVNDFDVVEFFQVITERCLPLLGVDAAGLMLADQRGGLHPMASTTPRAHAVDVFGLQARQGPCADALTTGQPVVNVDLPDAGRRWPELSAAAAAAGYGTTHALPMRLRGRAIGALSLFTDAAVHLDGDDLAVGQAMADLATIGLLQEGRARDRGPLAEQLQAALDSRISIEQAKGIIATRTGTSVEDAFGLMRTHAGRRGATLTSVAVSVIDATLTADDLAQPDRD